MKKFFSVISFTVCHAFLFGCSDTGDGDNSVIADDFIAIEDESESSSSTVKEMNSVCSSDNSDGYAPVSSSQVTQDSKSSSSSQESQKTDSVGSDDTSQENEYLCNGKQYNPSIEFCGTDETSHEKCSGEEYDVAEYFCNEGTLYKLCNGKQYNPSIEFCDERDGNVYEFVVINDIIWMKQNLKFKMNESSCYDNKDDNCVEYGRLYSTIAAENACPEGWNLPTLAQMLTLDQYYYDYTYGYIMTSGGTKLKSTSKWVDKSNGTSGNGTDDLGFSALPAGQWLAGEKKFSSIGRSAVFWSGTKSSSARFIMGLYNTHSDVRIDYYGYDVNNYYSIRCVKQ